VLIELETGRQRFLGDVPDWTSAAFSSDMRLLALGGEANELRLIDLESGDETARWDIGSSFVDKLVFVPGKNLLISLGSNGLEIWNTGNQQRLYRQSDALAFGLLPDGGSVIMLSNDETITHLSLDTLEIIAETDAPDEAGLLVGPSADGQSLSS
jgi:WD40 repeat protein